MPLDDIKIRNLKPREAPYKAADEKGLFLLVNPATTHKPTGSKLWRMKFRADGKQKQLCLGAYPEVSLKQARQKRDEARAQLQAGVDPAAKKQADKRTRKLEAQNAFKAVALDFVAKMGRQWSERHRANAISRLEANIFPALGNRPIGQIEPPELLAVLRKIEARGAHEMSGRVRALCSQVFRYGVSCGVCARDPAADLRGALTPARGGNMPTIPLKELPELIQAIDACEEAPACRNRQTRIATQLLALTLVRTSELRKGLWLQIDWEGRTWTPAVEVMKKRRPHIVPLAPQAIAIFEELRDFTGHSRFMFPGEGTKGVMSENTILYALYALGYRGRMTGHGFRSLASTILNEAGFNPDWIELQLAHVDKNKIRAAYNHARYLEQRREMMIWYADYMDELRKGRFMKPHLFRRAVAA
jgi:integrase